MRITILYQDTDVVVIDKPAGMPTHAVEPGDPYPSDALRVTEAQLGLTYLGMHQRLDADTSGVLLFAARREANPALAAAFGGRAVRKVYLALVHGAPTRPAGVIDAPIARERGERYRVAAAGDHRGQRAVTRYRVLTKSDAYSLLEVTPETGRSHQIRVHLAHLGCPVLGDALYGPPDQPAPRLGLHAYQLTLPHPADGREITFTAAPPRLFAAFLLPALRVAAAQRHIRAAVRQPDALAELLALAIERRAPLAADPATTIYRLFNAAADGVPGLAVDRYGAALVASVYDEEGDAAAAPLPAALWEKLAGLAGAEAVYVKYRPKQAGRVREEEVAQLAPAEPVWGAGAAGHVAYEDGLSYLVRPGEGWSPGLFPDMREMRGRVRTWAAGRRVLNCFAFTCGFGVAATAGGAARVVNLDLSKSVLEWGQANYRANGFAADPYDFVYGDAFDWLARFGRRGELFDLVVLDPPGFARTKTRRFSAERDYGDLAGLAAHATAPGGLLVACCNVADLPWRAFRDRVLAGLAAADRSAEVAGVYHAPAIDFPAPPGREGYLKILVARLRG